MYRYMIRTALMLSLILCLLALPVLAADTAVYAFSEDDPLLTAEDSTLCGIFLTDLPASGCDILQNGRTLRAGDALTAEQLTQIQLVSTAEESTVADVTYLPIYEDGIGAAKTLHISLLGSKNQAPTAQDSQLETYKNLEANGTLNCQDPEGDALTYVLEKEPKRGAVTLHDDGTFTYTPKKNKVGTDTFTYHVEDAAGNCSEAAKVTIRLLKTSSADVFADMQGDPQEFEATFLRETGIFSGENIGGTLCFCPDKEVSSGEFLMMVMELTGLQPETVLEASAEKDVSWFSPWQTAALRAGISLREDSDAAIQKSDAAVLIAGVLDLPSPNTVTVFSDEEAYTQSACLKAMEEAGLPCFTGESEESLTRRDAAELLYRVSSYCSTNEITFPWNAKS